MIQDIDMFKKQHLDSYKNAILELIKNNTVGLVDQDILSLLKKPPLDSMDLFKSKLLDLAKKSKIILNHETLDEFVSNYRSELIKCCPTMMDIREKELCSIINKQHLKDSNDVYVLNQKDFSNINKKIMKLLKEQLENVYTNLIYKYIDTILPEVIDSSLKEKYIDDFTKYYKGNYRKSMIENVEIKIVVKDTTLINGVKEQGERYLFTLENSRIFQDLDEDA